MWWFFTLIHLEECHCQVSWNHFFHIDTAVDALSHWPVDCPVKMACYDWTEEEAKYVLQVTKEKNRATILERDLPRITVYANCTVQWKHLQIAIVLD